MIVYSKVLEKKWHPIMSKSAFSCKSRKRTDQPGALDPMRFLTSRFEIDTDLLDKIFI